MTEDTLSNNKRCLAGIESELHEAEKAFADANARFVEAERDRRIALETISKRQIEIDSAIALLREQSIPGTRWSQSETGNDPENEPLALRSEEILDLADRDEADERRLTSQSIQERVEEQFGKLRDEGRGNDEDPVLKVINGRRK